MMSRIRAIWIPAFAGEGLLLRERFCFRGRWLAFRGRGFAFAGEGFFERESCGRALLRAGGARFARGARFFRLGGGDGGFDDPAVKRK